MIRRSLLVTLALALGAWSVHAAEYATLILDDGERVSGTLASPSNSHDSLVGGRFNLAMGAGEPEQFPYSQVAVIDFAGGWPDNGELAALPTGQHMLAMRNGGTRVGHFINVVNGDTVRWQETGGAVQDIPVGQVARIYLDPQSAVRIFGNSGYDASYPSYQGYGAVPRSSSSYPQQRYGGQGYGYGNQVVVNDLPVPGNVPWTDSGLNVTRGDTLQFNPQGDVQFIRGANNTATASGRSDVRSDQYPVRWLGVGALVGKVGVNGTPFGIGATNGVITMPASGRLFLGINDDNFNDNAGAYRVTVMR